MGWSFLFRTSRHAAAVLAATLGFPLIERDLQFSLPASISLSRANSALLYVAVCLKAECALSAVFPLSLLNTTAVL